jgi:hypothetical protein
LLALRFCLVSLRFCLVSLRFCLVSLHFRLLTLLTLFIQSGLVLQSLLIEKPLRFTKVFIGWRALGGV